VTQFSLVYSSLYPSLLYSIQRKMASSFVLDDDDSDAGSNDMNYMNVNMDIAATDATAYTPSSMPSPSPNQMFDMTTGQFHPDFMFCGECKDPSREPDADVGMNFNPNLNPNPNGEGEEDVSLLESYLNTNKSNSKSKEAILIRSKFDLSNPITSASHILVIQSLLQPLPGVSKVMVQQPLKNQVLVDHDAQTSTESILHALASVGHIAVWQAPQASGMDNNAPLWVRSNFHVQGICCASEVPMVKKIVKPMPGVSPKVQINITTRTVYVQHDVNVTTAQQIANQLSREGFPAQIQKDGAIAAAAQQQALNQGRTTLHVNGVLLTTDIAPIQQRLSQILGVSRIGVNVSEAVIIIHHDIYQVTSEECVQALTPQYNTTVHIAASDHAASAAISALDHIGRSKYVESTIRMDQLGNLQQLRLVETTIRQNFIRSQVRAIYPNLQSQTIKVEHNPKLVSVLDVCQTLSSCVELPCVVAVNGADLNLWLPLQEEYPNSTMMEHQDNAMMHIHANVWLSGIFWFVSILSLVGGSWYVPIQF
jgi:copper chaperone CopZ